MGCLMEFYPSYTLFYTKMSFKILKKFQQTISLFPAHSTLEVDTINTADKMPGFC
jgi:hypothetical protein